MLQIPLLRAGAPYRSLNTVQISDLRTGEPVVEVSHANAGLIARDLRRQAAAKPLDGLTTAELMAICADAARRFTEDELPLGDDIQSADDYLRQMKIDITSMKEELDFSKLMNCIKKENLKNSF